MAAMLGAFMLWLLATGKYSDWAALAVAPPVIARPIVAANGATSEASNATPTASVTPGEAIKTGTDWINRLAGTVSSTGSLSNTDPFDTTGLMYA